MKPPIAIEVTIIDAPIKMGAPCLLKVVVRNTGDSAVTVNSRLAVGYKNSLARELFADLTDAVTNKPTQMYESDINRDFSKPGDYKVLQPGETVSTTFDLFEYYNPMKSGEYLLTISYQADEPLATVPETVLRGVFVSDPVKLNVLPAS
jgi:hypothetical protein